jgi:hypothetical protein
MMYVLDRIIENLRAAHRFRVREHMGEKKQSERNDAGQLMQFPKKKCLAESDSHNKICDFRFAIDFKFKHAFRQLLQ